MRADRTQLHIGRAAFAALSRCRPDGRRTCPLRVFEWRFPLADSFHAQSAVWVGPPLRRATSRRSPRARPTIGGSLLDGTPQGPDPRRGGGFGPWIEWRASVWDLWRRVLVCPHIGVDEEPGDM